MAFLFFFFHSYLIWEVISFPLCAVSGFALVLIVFLIDIPTLIVVGIWSSVCMYFIRYHSFRFSL